MLGKPAVREPCILQEKRKHPPLFPGSICFFRAPCYSHPGALQWHQEETVPLLAGWNQHPSGTGWTHLLLHPRPLMLHATGRPCQWWTSNYTVNIQLPNTGWVNQGTFYTTFPKSLNPSLFGAQQVGGRCAESHRYFYRGPFYFSILNGSTLSAITLQPPHSSVPAHHTTHPPHALVCNFLEDTVVSAELGGSWELSAPLKTEYNPISKL